MIPDDSNAVGRRFFFRRNSLIVAALLISLTAIAGAILIPPMMFRRTCERSIEELLMTRVDVRSADLSLFMKNGTIHDVVIYNPDGYVDEPFLVIPKVTFKKGVHDSAGDVVTLDLIELHAPVMYLVTAGETSNLKDLMARLTVPRKTSFSPVRIASLKITDGTIASYPDATGYQLSSPFPIHEIRDLEGNPGRIAKHISMELQESMDQRMKETVDSLKRDFIKGFSDLFDL